MKCITCDHFRSLSQKVSVVFAKKPKKKYISPVISNHDSQKKGSLKIIFQNIYFWQIYGQNTVKKWLEFFGQFLSDPNLEYYLEKRFLGLTSDQGPS